VLKRLADNRDSTSLASELRRKRFALFATLLDRLPRPVRILDVGGTADFWRAMKYEDPRVHLTILNRTPAERPGGEMSFLTGDARDMRDIGNRQFDVVFSNSVIEHVGDFADQRAMAEEVRRVADRYFVQTPNRYFPIEPHFLLPGFQFLPASLRASLHARRDLGWWKKAASYNAALREVQSIRLLSRRDLAVLFPGARLHRERFLGLTKSWIACGGW
jgi:hypothetical protein